MTTNLSYNGGLTLSIPVTDLDKSIGWYQNVLNFELLYRMDEIGWCELATGVERVNVGLSVREEPNPGGAVPTFGVDDIVAAKTILERRDVRLDGDINVIEDMVKLLTFYDPDANALMFYEDLRA